MKRQQFVAAMAAFLLSGLLLGCGGGNAAEIAEEIVLTVPPTAEPTKPPPIVSVNTVVPGGAGQPSSPVGEGGAPSMPTAVPTAIPTEAPPTAVPTDTPVPTAIPPTAAPVIIQPTAVPPTATPVPATPVPQGANGLIATHFALQQRAELFTNGDIWFEFNVANSTGNPVPFDALGVMPRKDGVDRGQWYQHSWGGNNDSIPPGGLTWDDHINLPEAGNYTLRLVVCFDGPACQAQTGTWHTLSGEIPITVVQR